MPYRILFIYPWMHAHTGSPRMLLNLVRALDRTRFAPVFLALGDGNLVDEMRTSGVEIVNGTAHICSLRKPLDLVKRAFTTAAQLAAWKIDLVHVNTWCWNLDLCFGAWLKRLPVVIHTHNPMTVHRSNLTRLIADKVLFVSEDQRSQTVGLSMINDKTEVLHNFIDFDYYGAGAQIREKLGLSREDFVVLTVAQISERKGIDIVIETARRCVVTHPKMRFLIVGDDAVNEASFAARMRAEVETSGLTPYVRFLGSRTDVPDILASADLLLHPARREPFGLVVIEAMAAGKPVVASAVGGITEIMHAVGGGGELVKDPTPEAFARVVISFCNAQDQCHAAGEKARSGARRRFSQQAIVPRLEQIYQDLLGSRRA